MRSTRLSDPKKPYSKPVLELHGDIRTLTAIVGNVNKFDGGGSGMNRTS
jgi:hypothetical protein